MYIIGKFFKEKICLLFCSNKSKIFIVISLYARYNIEPETKPDRPYIVKQFSRGPHHYLAVIDQITNKV